MEFVSLVFTCKQGKSYSRWFGALDVGFLRLSFEHNQLPLLAANVCVFSAPPPPPPQCLHWQTQSKGVQQMVSCAPSSHVPLSKLHPSDLKRLNPATFHQVLPKTLTPSSLPPFIYPTTSTLTPLSLPHPPPHPTQPPSPHFCKIKWIGT